MRLDSYSGAAAAAIRPAYEKARERPDDPAVLGELGIVLHAHADYAQALQCYDRARSLKDAFEWNYYSALAFEKLGRQAEAADAYRRALAHNKDSLPAELRLAELLVDSSKFDEARGHLNNILRREPAQPRAHYAMGRIQQATGDTAAAIASFRKAVDVYPAFGSAHYALALMLSKQGDTKEAQRHFALHKEYQLVQPSLDDPAERAIADRNLTAVSLIRQAAEAERGGDVRQAIDLLHKALAADPTQVQAHVNLLSLYGRAGKHDDALKHFNEAVKLAPNRADAYYDLGVLEFAARRIPAARKAFERALAINPQYAEAHNNLAFCLEMSGDRRGAEHHFREAVRLQPDYPLALYHLGRVLYEAHRGTEAAPFLARARDAATSRKEFDLAQAATQMLEAASR